MKKIYKIILLLFLSFPNFLYSEINNKIIAKVGNEIITAFELKNRINTILFLSNLDLNQANINRLKDQEFKYLINSKLKKIEVNKYKIKSDEAKLNQHLNNITSNNILGFKKKLIDNNLSYNLFLEDIETEFKWQRLVYTLYLEKINVNDTEIKNEIQKIQNTSITEFNLEKFDIINKNNFENFSMKLKKDIDKFNFEKSLQDLDKNNFTVKQSNLGWLNQKVLSERIYNEIKNLKINEISNPIIDENTITYLKIKNKRTSRLDTPNIDKQKEIISNKKKNELLKMYSNNHLSKVKSNVLIEIK